MSTYRNLKWEVTLEDFSKIWVDNFCKGLRGDRFNQVFISGWFSWLWGHLTPQERGLCIISCSVMSGVVFDLLSCCKFYGLCNSNCQTTAKYLLGKENYSRPPLLHSHPLTSFSRVTPGGMDSPSKYLHRELHIPRACTQVKFPFQVPERLRYPGYVSRKVEVNGWSSLTGLELVRTH